MPLLSEENAAVVHCQGLWQVVLGEQQLRTVVARDYGGKAKWHQDLAFVAMLPLRRAALQVTLHRARHRRQPGKPLAHAFIPLYDLLGSNPEASACQFSRPP